MYWYGLLPLSLLVSEANFPMSPTPTPQPATIFSVPLSTGQLVHAALPQPPADPPPPPNQRKPGGGLNPFQQACNSSNSSLTAIIPIDQHTLTTVAHPTLLFYISDRPEDVRSAEFSLLTSDEKKRLYRSTFTLPPTPGIISLRLPTLPQLALNEGQLYRWYLKLDCRSTPNNNSELDVNGWIQRLKSMSEQQPPSVSSPSIWSYDTAAKLVTQLRTSPDDPTLKARWQSLLQHIGLEELATAPFVGPVQLLEP